MKRSAKERKRKEERVARVYQSSREEFAEQTPTSN